MLTTKDYYNSVNLAKKIKSFKLIATIVVGVNKIIAVIIMNPVVIKLKQAELSFINDHVNLVSFAIKTTVIFTDLTVGEFVEDFEIIIEDNLGLCFKYYGFRAKGTILVEATKA